jgi:hypothetical protein
MRIYLLVPLHTNDPIWMFSIMREPVQVMAPSESEARLRASLRYGRRRTGEHAGGLRDPWLDARWVYAHVVEKTDPAMPLVGWDGPPAAPTPPQRTDDSWDEQTRR